MELDGQQSWMPLPSFTIFRLVMTVIFDLILAEVAEPPITHPNQFWGNVFHDLDL